MNSEMQSMYDNQIWNLLGPPIGAKIINCKWIYELKAGGIFKQDLLQKVLDKLVVAIMMKPFHQSLCLNPLGFFLP